MTQLRQDVRLSPDGRWLVSIVQEDQFVGTFSHDSPANTPYRVVAEGVPVFESLRQWLVVRRLDDDAPARTLQLTDVGDEYLDLPIVHDDGTVMCADRGYRQLFRWAPDGSKRARPLHDSWQHGTLHLRPDGRALLLQLPEDDECEEGLNACLIGLDDHVEHVPKLACNAVNGWTRDLEAVIVVDGPTLARVNLRSGVREVIANEMAPSAASAAWFVWAGRNGFWRLATDPDGRPTAMPALVDWYPLTAIDDDRFLCRTVDLQRCAIVDVSRDLAPIVEIGSLPAGPIAYSRAIDAFVTWREESGSGADVETWSRDGVRLRNVSLLAAQ